MQSIATFSFLLAIWIVFSGQFDAFHLALGVVSAAIVTYSSRRLFLPETPPNVVVWTGRAWRLGRYVVWLLYQIVLANLHVLHLALHPRGRAKMDPTIHLFTTGLQSDWAKYVLATSITLTPGTVTISIVGSDFYVHAISEKAAALLDGEMERRVAALFEEKREE